MLFIIDSATWLFLSFYTERDTHACGFLRRISEEEKCMHTFQGVQPQLYALVFGVKWSVRLQAGQKNS